MKKLVILAMAFATIVSLSATASAATIEYRFPVNGSPSYPTAYFWHNGADWASSHPDWAFYVGKEQSALYYARNVLPSVMEKAARMAAEDRTPIDIPDAAFATV